MACGGFQPVRKHTVTQAEKDTIETFCNELSLALCRITGETIDIQPDLLACTSVADEQPEMDQRRLGDLDDLPR
jgi:hypothetical protein